MRDNLGDRMKSRYENRTRYYLPRRTYTVLRIDGKSFHTYTQNFDRPFDATLINAMNHAAKHLCINLAGCRFAYTQSDEISVLLTDFTKPETEAWFDGNLQKAVSVSASIATAYFNAYMKNNVMAVACFDSRAFTIADPVEVENYFIWRQQDWTRNSITAVAQSLYSHKQLHKKNTTEMQEMIFQKGQNWNNYPTHQKRGRVLKKNDVGVWSVDNEIPIFTKDRKYLRSLIPTLEAFEEEKDNDTSKSKSD